MRGNPDNLRRAAAAKTAAATTRAEQGIHDLVRRGEPITFRGWPKPPECHSISSTATPRSVSASNNSATNSAAPHRRRRTAPTPTSPAAWSAR